MLDREKGIQVIIELQKFGGFTETVEQAAAGWDGMSEQEQEQTLAAHKALCSDSDLYVE